MSDDMLHAILQMPPDLWSDREIWQRHGRYLEASKRIIELDRQLDWALKSREAVWNSWNKALEERDEAMSALEWIASRYSHEKTTFQLAQEAYEMSSKARWTLQEIEQKEEA